MIALILALLLTLPLPASAHPGRLDAQGGHQDRTSGEYHYHQMSPAEKDRRIGEYFRQANENVGALDCGQTNHKRKLSAAEKEKILDRDGRRCAICSVTARLEVDHRRALMNGGDNAPENLGVLCDDCHKAKTRMDNSLRRKREKICAPSTGGTHVRQDPHRTEPDPRAYRQGT